ncbi:hypothetical protein GCM10020331_045070 [Ectobacillus funiculus]
MQFKVKALEEDEYKAWIAAMKKKQDGKETAATAQAQQGEEIFPKELCGLSCCSRQ